MCVASQNLVRTSGDESGPRKESHLEGRRGSRMPEHTTTGGKNTENRRKNTENRRKNQENIRKTQKTFAKKQNTEGKTRKQEEK